MAMPQTSTHTAFHIEPSFAQPRPHHASIKALWEGKWHQPVFMGIYPFVDGKVEDFEPVFQSLINADLHEPYNPDEYAAAFLALLSRWKMLHPKPTATMTP